MFRLLFFISVVFWGPFVHGQTPAQPLISLDDIERSFLQNNFELLVARFNIDRAEAARIGASKWNNPSFTVHQLNFWSNPSAERLPQLIGNYGSTQQIAVDLEQIIETARKRHKRAAIRSLEVDHALLEWEELLIELKLELRSTYWDLIANEKELAIQRDIVGNLKQIVNEYKTLAEKGLAPKAEYMRIQTQYIQAINATAQLENQNIELLSKLKMWTRMPTLTGTALTYEVLTHHELSQKVPLDIVRLAKEESVTALKNQKQIEIANSLMALERANRHPDMKLIFSYDRGGSMMRDFIGFGVGFDLPLFNRNQMGIQHATAQVEQSKMEQAYGLEYMENRIQQLLIQLNHYEEILKELKDENLDEFDDMLAVYQEHLNKKQITVLEYMDFLTAYQTALQNRIELEQNYMKTFEELQYVVGKDF